MFKQATSKTKDRSMARTVFRFCLM